MNDNVVDIKKLKSKKFFRPKNVFIIIMVLILVVVGVCIAIKSDFRFWISKEVVEISMAQNSIASSPVSANSSLITEKYKNGVVVCADNSVYALNEDLEVLWNKEISVASPIVEVAGNYVMVADRGGRNYYMYNNDKTVFEKQSDSTVTGISVSENGSYVVICEQASYLGSVALYSADGDKMYEWFSGDGYIIDAAYIQQTKTLAVTTLEVQDAVSAQVLFFDIYSSEPIAKHTYDDTIITNMFSADGCVYAVADNKTIGYERSGKEKFSYDYSGRSIEKCVFDNGSELVLAFKTSLSGSDIVVIDAKGNEKCVISTDESINYISVDSNKIAFNGGGGISVYTMSGQHIYNIITDRDVKDICLFKKASRFFGISSVSFDVVKIQ